MMNAKWPPPHQAKAIPADTTLKEHPMKVVTTRLSPSEGGSVSRDLPAGDLLLEVPPDIKRPPAGFLARSFTYEDVLTGQVHRTHLRGGCACRRQHPGITCSVARLIESWKYLPKYRAMFAHGEGVYLLAAAAYVTKRLAGQEITEAQRYFATICAQDRWERTRGMLQWDGWTMRFQVTEACLVHDAVAEARFMDKISKGTGDGACSLWTACCDKDGYPRYFIGNKEVRAHRWLFANVILPQAQHELWATGDLGRFAARLGLGDDTDTARMLVLQGLPGDWDVDHTCGVRRCMRHLRPMPREINRSRARNPAPPEVQLQERMNRLAMRMDWSTAACNVSCCTAEVACVVLPESGLIAPVCAMHRETITRKDYPVMVRPGYEPGNPLRSETSAAHRDPGDTTAAARTRKAAAAITRSRAVRQPFSRAVMQQGSRPAVSYSKTGQTRDVPTGDEFGGRFINRRDLPRAVRPVNTRTHYSTNKSQPNRKGTR